MEFRLTLLLIAVSICTSEAFSLFGNLLKEKRVTCSIKNLSVAARSWRFTTSLICANEVIDIHSDKRIAEASKGIQCRFSYSCPFDASLDSRSSSLVCDQTGKWSGAMPNCKNDESVVSSILNVFEGLPPTVTTNEEVIEEEEPEDHNEESQNEDAANTTTMIAPLEASTGGLELIQREKTNHEILFDLCNQTSICTNLSSISQCHQMRPKGVSPRFFPNLKKVFVQLCFYCFQKTCRYSRVKLI